MLPTKTIHIDDDVLAILTNTFQIEQVNGNFVGRLTCGQLDRKMYERVNKAIVLLGGKWNRVQAGHVFQYDPREQLTSLLDTGKIEVAKEGWFPTPEHIARRMYDDIGWGGGYVLEPSAGEGHIADVISRVVPKNRIRCVEMNPNRAAILRNKGYNIIETDFMLTSLETFSVPRFSRVFMNPPFENGQDIDHVLHAFDLLQPGGGLAAIMSEGPFFRQDKKAVAFREWLDSVNGWADPLVSGTFAESGTGVNTRLVVAWRNR